MSSSCAVATANKWSNTARLVKWLNRQHLKWTLLNAKLFSNEPIKILQFVNQVLHLLRLHASVSWVCRFCMAENKKSITRVPQCNLGTCFHLTGSTHASAHPEQMHFSRFLLVQFRFSAPLFLSLSFLSLRFAARENKMFSENEIRNITFQVLSGLVFVHKHGKRLPSIALSLCSVAFVLQ